MARRTDGAGQRRVRRAAVGVALLVGVGCAKDGGPGDLLDPGGLLEPEPGTLVEGDGYEGVLLDAGLDWMQTADGTVVTDDDVASFVPTDEDVARFETSLPDAVSTATDPGGEGPLTADDLRDHVRQYTGVADQRGEDRQLVVAGICAEAAGDMEWQRGWIEVSDGGTCFWDATMDLATGDILRFSFHGSA